MNLEATNKLSDVPVKTLQSICDWLLVEDEDLRIACLDFLYLFTGFPDNVELLAHEVNVEAVVGGAEMACGICDRRCSGARNLT